MNPDSELRYLLDKVRRNKGIDFSLYRMATISRRAASRLRKTGCSGYMEYIAYLNRHPEEYDRFVEEVTINVTEFFRDRGTFAAIEGTVLREIMRKRQEGRPGPVRVWCAGSSGGQEAYSLAILFLEAKGEKAGGLNVRIWGTDIDPDCVEKAKRGFYEPSHLKEVDSRLVDKYFLKEGENYRVKDGVRRLTEFRAHNLVSDPPLTNMDLILCRNVMIYFTRPLQEAAYSALAKGLDKGGFLVLGKSETLWGRAQDCFETIENRERIYRKI
jgi:chemotaxis protein methyltransferase CheR